MHWIRLGEVDVSTCNGALYLIDANNTPLTNTLNGDETLPLGEPQEDPDDPDDETAVDGRTRAAEICAQHANQPDETHTFLDAW